MATSAFFTKIPSVSSIFSLYTSLSSYAFLFRTIIDAILPKKIQTLIVSRFENYFSSYFNSDFTFIVEDQWDHIDNPTFRAAEVYLPTLLGGITTRSLLVGSNNHKDSTAKPKYGVPLHAKMVDEFEGIRLEWTFFSEKNERRPYDSKQKRYFHLTCKNEYREKIMSDYFTYIRETSVEILAQRDNLKIHTYHSEIGEWEATMFQHHTTFETLAIEPELKNKLISDLDAFSNRKEFFKSVGRAWKRGYLLYGPPGTGKSSLVAAIANYMCYSIYDLQLQSVKDDAKLREILTSTENRSILLIEDIDCNGADASCRNEKKAEYWNNQNNKEKKVTLSGLLNFVDGLWSSCVEQRIIIFTTNHIEKLDPALLRPGRMDIHVLMGYCTPFVFKKLVAMYLEVKGHHLFESIEEMILDVKVTPAEVTEKLMGSEDHDATLHSLLEFLETKKKVTEESDESEEEDEVEEA